MITENEKQELMVLNFAILLINQEDFGILTKMNNDKEKIFVLYDYQKGNLGNINQKEFNNYGEIIDSLDIYHEDYIYRSLEERESIGEKIDKDDFDFVAKRFLESDEITSILKSIDVDKHFELTKLSHSYDYDDHASVLYISDMLSEEKDKDLEI